MSEVKTDSVVNVSGDNDSGIDLSTNDVVAIKTANSERVRVNASGNVGIGTTSPSTALHVEGANGDLLTVKAASGSEFAMRVDGNEISFKADADNDEASSVMTFDVDGSEAMRIDSSGNVGIGETSPLGTAHIRTSDASLTSVNANADDLILENNGNCGMSICSSTSGEGNINFIDSDDTNIGRIQYNHSTDQMDFRVNDTVRMCIRSGGEVNIGSASSSPTGANNQTRLTVKQNQGTDAVFIDRTADIDSSFRDLVRFARNGTTVGQIKAKNTAVQYNTTSDARLKENIEDMTGAIDRVKTLKPKRYSWIVDELDTPNVDGFLAHEAQTVVPDAVSGTQNEVDDDGNPVYQGIDHGLLVPLLTGALKEAIAKIETLETKVAALEAGE